MNGGIRKHPAEEPEISLAERPKSGAAAALAANAAARMNDVELKSPVSGQIRLTLAAAEARLGHADRARRALVDFNAAVPAVRSIAAIRKCVYRADALSDFEPFYAGLKLAGVPD